MQYMLLIHDESALQQLPDAERGKLMQEYFAYTNGLRESGAYVDGNPLQPATAAATVRVRDGERLVTDGPFAETKEQLGGYYIVEADSIEEAIEHAARIPSARIGTIEVRPVLQIPAETPA